MIQALTVKRSMTSDDIAGAKSLINKILKVKFEIEAFAETFGYPDRCRNSIADCRGNCCRWHFPKHLDEVDFFLSIWELAPPNCQNLLNLFKSKPPNFYYCPMLQTDGCFFSFKERPIQCTIAYPCFAQKNYRNYASQQMAVLDQLKNDLKEILYNVKQR